MENIKKQLSSVTKLIKPVARQHVFIILLSSLGFLIFAVYSASQTVQLSTDEDYRTEAEANSIRTHFDQNTIDSIRELRRGSEGGNIDLGQRNRQSPFIE